MIDIAINTKSKLRYVTAGDYYDYSGVTMIEVMQQKNEDYEMLIAVHELVECYLTKKAGIPEPDIIKFDMEFKGDTEPGDEKNAPYHKQHKQATKIEKMFCKMLGIDWETYNNEIIDSHE